MSDTKIVITRSELDAIIQHNHECSIQASLRHDNASKAYYRERVASLFRLSKELHFPEKLDLDIPAT